MNLTLSIDDQLLEKARLRAAEMGTTVNQLVRDHFRHLVGENDAEAWIAEFQSLSGQGHSGGEKFDREALYSRR